MTRITETSDTISSRAVSWWAIHEFVLPWLGKVGSCPMAGTPAWCALDDRDPRKWAALLDAARHHALRVETAQIALADASRAISEAGDWSGIAREMRGRAAVYIPRVVA
jgi:hypothetical protein